MALRRAAQFLRKDRFTGDWVVFAPNRGKRPKQTKAARSTQKTSLEPSHNANCPFCPGNEALTPPPLLEIPDPSDPNKWKLRVIPNKYPALTCIGSTTESATEAKDRAEKFDGLADADEFEAVGHHEVVVESPNHNQVRRTTNHAI
jgi:UDPglucose--hexose-1-phosphate uridylyltransferase